METVWHQLQCHASWLGRHTRSRARPARISKITRRILRTPEQGADTIVWLATAREAGDISGKLLLDRQVHSAHLLRATREAPREKRQMKKYLNEVAASVNGGLQV